MALVLKLIIFLYFISTVHPEILKMCEVCKCENSLGVMTINCTQVSIPPLPWESPNGYLHIIFNSISNFSWHSIPQETHDINLKNIDIIDAINVDLFPNLESITFNHCTLENNTLENSGKLKKIGMISCSLTNENSLILPQNTNVKIIDVSKNLFKTVPNFPSAEELNLDHNPIVSLESTLCQPMENVKTLSLSGAKLKEIPNQGFLCILGESPIVETPELFINLSYNQISYIHPNAFSNMALSKIDLSHNKLKSISEYAIKWRKVKYINLQFNPWRCDCDAKWMMDVLVPYLYDINPSLLIDFRCGFPSKRFNKEIVYWMNHTKGSFCDDGTGLVYYESNGAVLKFWTISSIASIVLSCIIVILLIALIVVLWSPNRKLSRKQSKLPNYEIISASKSNNWNTLA